MGFAELFILAVGLSMDAFAVAVCKGLSLRRAGWKEAGIVGLYFGIFQAGMPLIGYFLGIQFEGFIKEYDHWISFILLSFIGVSMLWEALHKEKASGTPDKTDKKNTDSLGFRVMLLLALASGSALRGGLSMLCFSLGTLPLLLGFGSLAAWLGKKFTGAVLSCGAVLIAVFGLSMLSQGGSLTGLFTPTVVLLAAG